MVKARRGVNNNFYLLFVPCRGQKTAHSPEQAAATRGLEQCAWTQSPYLIVITGTNTTSIT